MARLWLLPSPMIWIAISCIRNNGENQKSLYPAFMIISYVPFFTFRVIFYIVASQISHGSIRWSGALQSQNSQQIIVTSCDRFVAD